MSQDRFWEHKSLQQMTREEWESLCDGCARCCLIKLEDENTGDIHYTNVVCDLMDHETCGCTQYEKRAQYVPQCVVLTPDVLDQLHWMPSTCAYRLLYEGKPLPDWHPLITGDPDSVHLAGISVRGRVYRQCDVNEDQLEDHIVTWPE
ncbi:MAG: YcgN family cysteine cluster protein [Gammaproteobacteria bacterium]